MRVKIQWSFLYENETTEDIEYEDGDNLRTFYLTLMS